MTAKKQVRTKGTSEMIVKRQLGILQELMDVCSLKLCVDFVPSKKNKADVLTSEDLARGATRGRE